MISGYRDEGWRERVVSSQLGLSLCLPRVKAAHESGRKKVENCLLGGSGVRRHESLGRRMGSVRRVGGGGFLSEKSEEDGLRSS
jgi:hypothetical protein